MLLSALIYPMATAVVIICHYDGAKSFFIIMVTRRLMTLLTTSLSKLSSTSKNERMFVPIDIIHSGDYHPSSISFFHLLN